MDTSPSVWRRGDSRNHNEVETSRTEASKSAALSRPLLICSPRATAASIRVHQESTLLAQEVSGHGGGLGPSRQGRSSAPGRESTQTVRARPGELDAQTWAGQEAPSGNCVGPEPWDSCCHGGLVCGHHCRARLRPGGPPLGLCAWHHARLWPLTRTRAIYRGPEAIVSGPSQPPGGGGTLRPARMTPRRLSPMRSQGPRGRKSIFVGRTVGEFYFLPFTLLHFPVFL